METIEVTLYTKKQCPLCEKAESALEAVKKKVPLSISSVDIYEDEALLEQYHIRIPVVEANGEVIAEGIVTEAMLTTKLVELARGIAISGSGKNNR